MSYSHPTGARFLDVSSHRLHVKVIEGDPSRPPLVFLHEGLGSVDLWRGFPADVTRATGNSGLIYSRHGNGWSTPLQESRQPGYMYEEAVEVLPRVISVMIDRPPILVGHSDGASIAIIYGGSGLPVEGLVLIAPHLFVESESIESIQAIRDRFPGSNMTERMSRYHEDPEKTFYGWADIWLDPAFRDWNIEDFAADVACPSLLIQGDADEYGTLGQLDAFEARAVAPVSRLVVPGAGHSPHLSHRDAVIRTVVDFVERLA